MMINCKEASRLISEEMDHGLSFSGKLKLRFHLLMCRLCRRYQEQIDFLHDTSKELGKIPPESLPSEKNTSRQGLSRKVKDQIRKDLSRK
jgi:hypothetical protein